MSTKSPQGVQSIEEKRKRTIVFSLLVYSAFIGSISVLLPEIEHAADAILSLPFLVLAISWCLIDARGIGILVMLNATC